MAGPLSVFEAQDCLLLDVHPLGHEQVVLETAHHRILAQDLIADFDQPPFAASAMDGFALQVKAFDDTAPGETIEQTFAVIGTASAGHPFDGKVGLGEAVRIFTGGVMPNGADTVVIQEECQFDATARGVTVLSVPEPFQYVRPQGYDFQAGSALVPAGARLHFRHLALIASMNLDHIPVVARPRVAIIATGDELVLPGDQMGPGQIVSSVPYGLKALVERAGGRADLIGIARDDVDDLKAKIALSDECDILVTIGGASVGDHDLVQEALVASGMTLDFWRIAMRPGKPLMVGHRNGALRAQKILGLPGNPVSALITGKIFLEPLIKAFLGVSSPLPRTDQARLLSPLKENGSRQHYMRAHVDFSPDGYGVRSMEDQDSSLQALFATSNALIVRPPQAEALSIGDLVDIIRLDLDS